MCQDVKEDPNATTGSEVTTQLGLWEPATQRIRTLAPGSGPTFNQAMKLLGASTNVSDLNPDAKLRWREGDAETVMEFDAALGPGQEDERRGPMIIRMAIRRFLNQTGTSPTVDDADDRELMRSLVNEIAKELGYAGFQPGP